MATQTNATELAAKKPASDAHRDPRLDFFRGLGMFIILIAHTPLNGWTKWIPARFGYSDATEIFVFCSGAASAIAFMKVFETRGWAMGVGRVSYRLWQIYWSHIGVLLAVAAAMIAVDTALETGGFYLASLGLPPYHLYGNDQMLAMMTLTYVPNLFDILPMYFVILALMPIVAALTLESRAAAMAFVVTLYLAGSQPWILFEASTPLFRVTTSLAVALGVAGLVMVGLRGLDLRRLARAGAIVGAVVVLGLAAWLWSASPFLSTLINLDLPARPWDDSRWFFNPFAWQLIFFTGFAFSLGWIPPPPIRRSLMIVAAVIVVVCVPLDPDGAFHRELSVYIRDNALAPDHWLVEFRDGLRGLFRDLGALSAKTYFGLFRFLHFLAVAYLAWALAGERGAHLPNTGIGGRIVTIVRRVGQQSLAVFVASLVIARLLGVWLRETSAGPAARVGVENAFSRRAIDPDLWVTIGANIVGFALIIAVAYVARYYRRQPWRAKSN